MASAHEVAEIGAELAEVADRTGFSGVAVVTCGGRAPITVLRGHAERPNRRPNRMTTRFAVASVTKGLTALAVASLVDDGLLTLDTTLRDLAGAELPLVDDSVTVAHLLEHTSGVGDYLDEDEIDDIDAYALDVPAHRLADVAGHIDVVDGHPQTSAPGERFAYNNGGYVMLAVAIERAAGAGYHDVVRDRALAPAGMADSGFFRSDDLPADAAIGYLGSGRTNVFNVPVRGVGDGGAYSTAADLGRFWASLFDGRIVALDAVEELVVARHTTDDGSLRYGRGFWLRPDRQTVMLEGMDAGISCRTAHDRVSGVGYTVLSNTADGAWPLVGLLDERLPALVDALG